MTDKIHCENCRFWATTMSKISDVNYADGVGECRRNAPQGPVMYYQGSWACRPKDFQVISGFPNTLKDEWCGEAEPQ